MQKRFTTAGIVLTTFWFALAGAAAEVDWTMDPMSPNLDDVESLQRGMALFVNFCLGCHSVQYQRYERTATDLGNIPAELMLENVIFTGQRVGGYMTSSINEEDAKAWFGAAPPDLTMVTRVRSPEWVYNFLKTFYADESRPFGVNNKVFPNVAMPHVLQPLQGIADEVCYGYQAIDVRSRQKTIESRAPEEAGAEPDPGSKVIGRELNCPEVSVRPGTGTYDEAQYDQVAYDLANFLHYMGDPTRQERISTGTWVIGFLVVLLVLAYFLNRSYWSGIHGRNDVAETE